MTQDANVKIAELEQQVAELTERHVLNAKADERIEVAIRERLSLHEVLGTLFPLLTEHLGARVVFVRTYDETLTMRDHAWPHDADVTDLIDQVSHALPHRATTEAGFVIAQRVDVAGQDFGTAGVVLDQSPPAERLAHLTALLDV